jgi:hypothetical protein
MTQALVYYGELDFFSLGVHGSLTRDPSIFFVSHLLRVTHGQHRRDQERQVKPYKAL